MKKLLLLFALLIFACSKKLFSQEYMKLSKKDLRIEHQKKLNKIDSLKQVLYLYYSKNQNLLSDLNNANNNLSITSNSLKKSKNKLSQLGFDIDSLVRENSAKIDLIKELMDSISNQKLLIKKLSQKKDEFQIINSPEFLNGLYSTDCKREHWGDEGYSLGLYFNNNGGSITFNIDRGFGSIKKVYFNEYENSYRLDWEDVRYGENGIFEFKYNKEKEIIILDSDILIKCKEK